MLLVTWNSNAMAKHHFVVELLNKDTSAFNSTTSTSYLSQRSIERRSKQNITVDISDFPLTSMYVDSLAHLAHVRCKSKWLNCVVLEMSDTSTMDIVRNTSFVKDVTYIGKSSLPSVRLHKSTVEFDYGAAQQGITQLNAQCIHQKGHTGEGILIGILDDGFSNVDKMEIFDQLRDRLVGTKNFVLESNDVYNLDVHGTHVLSVIAGKKDTEYVGSAPDASYVLVVTEDNREEIKLEEYFWAAGAEFADSCGVDLINSSLGYSEFDDPKHDYSPTDIGTNKAIVSQAARWASVKGILVFNSAGNEGDDPWKHITFPADEELVFSVGSVTKDGSLSGFSSTSLPGLSYTKPNLCALGEQTSTSSSDGTYTPSNGTSFASPLLCGVAACIWQALPELSAQELHSLLEEQGQMFGAPTLSMGNGIPDFSNLCSSAIPLSVIEPANTNSEVIIRSTHQDITVSSSSPILTLKLVNLQGQTSMQVTGSLGYTQSIKHVLPTGIYLCIVQTESGSALQKIFVQ